MSKKRKRKRKKWEFEKAEDRIQELQEFRSCRINGSLQVNASSQDSSARTDFLRILQLLNSCNS